MKADTSINYSESILDFLKIAEKLKTELRHGWTSSGRRESVAEHSWRLALFVLAAAPYLDKKIDLTKALSMAILHDISEIYAGDIPFFEAPTVEGKINKRKQDELAAVRSLSKALPESLGSHILELWTEFLANISYEARLVNALDKIEAQIQHNEADISTWISCEYDAMETYLTGHCEFDSFILQIANLVKAESRRKIACSKAKTNPIVNKLQPN